MLSVEKGSVTDMRFDSAAQMLNFSGYLPEAQRRWVQGLVCVYVCVCEGLHRSKPTRLRLA